MKIELTVTKDFEVKKLLIKAGVRYWEGATVDGVEDENGDLIPCRADDLWCPLIDIEEGAIVNWNKGVKATVRYKVCDAGSYYLQDDNGNEITSIEDDYVPDIACPEGEGYGDYIIMNIDENGKIDNWNPKFDDFISE